MNDLAIQWSRMCQRFECVECGGISLSRDYDSMGHRVDDARVEQLREKYETAKGEANNRFKTPNTLYHKTGCKWMEGNL